MIATGYRTKTAAATASAAPTDPPIWLAPPTKGDAVGVRPDAVGLDPLLLMLLTTKDGQGVPSDREGLLRVTVTSGAGPVGQAVPQAARTVDCRASDEARGQQNRSKHLLARWQQRKL